MTLLKITMTVDDEGEYDQLMEQLIGLGAYDIEDEEAPEPEPHRGGGPKK